MGVQEGVGEADSRWGKVVCPVAGSWDLKGGQLSERAKEIPCEESKVSSCAFTQCVVNACPLHGGHRGFKTEHTPCLRGVFNMQMCIVSLQGEQSLGGKHLT